MLGLPTQNLNLILNQIDFALLDEDSLNLSASEDRISLDRSKNSELLSINSLIHDLDSEMLLDLDSVGS